MTSVEQKYDDVSIGTIRSDKDDFKAQAFQQRVGQKEVPTEFREAVVADVEQPAKGSLGHVLDEVTGLQGKTNVNAALAPVVHTAELKSGKEGLDHVTGLQTGKFGSVHSSGVIAEEVEEPSVVTFHNRPIAHSPPSLQKPVIHRGTSGDPLPSQLELPGAIGEAAGKGWDAIQERARPQIEKAKELWHIWKGEERRQSGDREESLPGMSAFRAQGGHLVEPKEHDASTGPSGLEGIKMKANQVLEDQIKPGVAKIQAKANELLQRNKPKEKAAPTQRTARSFKAAPRDKAETIGHRMIRYKNKLIDLWEGEEPLVKAKVQQGVQVLKDYRMDIPMLALATLLVLWASVSFVTWMAFPAKPLTEQVVLYDGTHKHDGHPIAHENEFSAWNVPDFQHEVDYPTGDQKLAPLQDVPNARVFDRVKMGVNGLNRRLSDELDDIKMHGADRLHHLKDAIPTSLGDLKDSVVDRVTDRLHHIKDAIPTSFGDLKQRARGSLGVGSEQNMDLYELNHQLGDDIDDEREDIDGEEDEFESDDADAPPHWHTAPESGSQKSQSTISHADIEEALQKDLHGGEQRQQGGVPQHQHTQQAGVQRDIGQQQRQMPQDHRSPSGMNGQPQQRLTPQELHEQQLRQHSGDVHGPEDPRFRHVRPAVDMTARQYQQQGINQDMQRGINQQQGIQQQQGANPIINQQGVRQPGVQQGVHQPGMQSGMPHMHTDGSQVGTLQELEERQLGTHHQQVDPNVETQLNTLSHTPTIARQAQEHPNIQTGQVPPQAQWDTQPNDRVGDLASRQHPTVHQDHLGQAVNQQARPQSAIPAHQQVHTQTQTVPIGNTQPANANLHHHHVHQHTIETQQPGVPSQMNQQAMPNGQVPQPHVHHQHMHTIDANGQPIQGRPTPGQPHTHVMHDHIHAQQQPNMNLNGGRV